MNGRERCEIQNRNFVKEPDFVLFKKVLRTDKDGAIAIDPITGSISSSKVGAFGLPVMWRIGG